MEELIRQPDYWTEIFLATYVLALSLEEFYLVLKECLRVKRIFIF
jgi:hypothetical protein